MIYRLYLVEVFVALLPAVSWCACPLGYTQNADRCYRAFGDMIVNQPEAEIYCQEAGGHLVKVLDAQVNKFLQGLMRDNNGRPGEYLTGASDIMIEGEWMWLPSKEPVMFKDWNPGEPNGVENEDCMVLFLNSDGAIKWNDFHCPSAFFNFICERPAIIDGQVG